MSNLSCGVILLSVELESKNNDTEATENKCYYSLKYNIKFWEKRWQSGRCDVSYLPSKVFHFSIGLESLGQRHSLQNSIQKGRATWDNVMQFISVLTKPNQNCWSHSNSDSLMVPTSSTRTTVVLRGESGVWLQVKRFQKNVLSRLWNIRHHSDIRHKWRLEIGLNGFSWNDLFYNWLK